MPRSSNRCYCRCVLLVGVFVVGFSIQSFAQSNCPTANPNDQLPDDGAINECLSRGSTTLVHGSPGYILTNTLHITQPGTTLLGDAALANFVASPNLIGRMLEVNSVNNVTLQNLWFDGNKGARTSCSADGTGRNIVVIGDGFVIDNVGSINAVCGSAAEVQGSGIRVSNSFFASNGYPQPNGPLADGLTVWFCVNGSIYGNVFRDNTDVDLIIGGSSSCSAYNNEITHYNVHGVAGINIGFFYGLNGNHAGSSFHDNTVDAGINLLGFGIMVGNHPWTPDPSQQVSNAASTYSNRVTGAAVNFGVDWITDGYIAGNALFNPQGLFAWPCYNSANYTGGNIMGGFVEAGYTAFDYQRCAP